MNRYIFTTILSYENGPSLDSFHEVKSPEMDPGHFETMTLLGSTHGVEELKKDAQVYNGMTLRMRFNQNIYQKICMIRFDGVLEREDLDLIIQEKHRANKLIEFLDGAAIGA